MRMSVADSFLVDKRPTLVSYVSWGQQQLNFDVASYLSTDLPAPNLITSVRGIVLYQDRVVVLENKDGRHFMPGGRIEPHESFDACLCREIREECGLQVESSEMLGFLHFRHRQPEPENYPYPYPDMFHLIYSVVGNGELSQSDVDGYEFASYLYAPLDALKLRDTEPGHPFLRHAVGIQHEV
jgi:ADP-ribose pyrophosphatase YjhB (NUDIX family)